MQQFYERLITRMSTALKPVSSAYKFHPKKINQKSLGFNPFITISRKAGSGGKPIAKKVAKLTGFKFCGKEIVEKVAKSSKLRAELLKSLDEKSRTSVQDMVHSFFNPDYISDIQYIHKLCDVLLSLSEQGDTVLLGRGAPFVTSASRGLHVRITAPYPVRVERAIKHEHISETKAKNIIKKTEEERRQFVQQYFGKNIDNSKYFDLTINTSFISITDAANIIVNTFNTKFTNYLHRFKILQKRRRLTRPGGGIGRRASFRS